MHARQDKATRRIGEEQALEEYELRNDVSGNMKRHPARGPNPDLAHQGSDRPKPTGPDAAACAEQYQDRPGGPTGAQ